MKLKEQITNDRNIAMKNQDIATKNSLSTLIGELDRITKNPTDEQIISVVKKFIEGCKECNNLEEAKLMEKYLPQSIDIKLTLDEYIKNINPEAKVNDLGKFMSYLKQNFAGKYDGKQASEEFKKNFDK